MGAAERAELEYIIMNPLVQEGVEPDYVWTLMSEMVLTFPNWEEFKHGAKVFVQDILGNACVDNFSLKSTRMEIWITFKKS